MLNCFRAVIDLWPSCAEFARDIDAPYNTAAAWYGRNSIPPEHWAAIIVAAERRGFEGVTAEALTAIAANRKAA